MYADDIDISGTEHAVTRSAMDHSKRFSICWSLPKNEDKRLSKSFCSAAVQKLGEISLFMMYGGTKP